MGGFLDYLLGAAFLGVTAVGMKSAADREARRNGRNHADGNDYYGVLQGLANKNHDEIRRKAHSMSDSELENALENEELSQSVRDIIEKELEQRN